MPGHLLLLEDRPEREAEGREEEGRGGDGARAVGRERHETAPRDRLPLERAGDLAVGRVLRLWDSARVRHEVREGALPHG